MAQIMWKVKIVTVRILFTPIEWGHNHLYPCGVDTFPSCSLFLKMKKKSIFNSLVSKPNSILNIFLFLLGRLENATVVFWFSFETINRAHIDLIIWTHNNANSWGTPCSNHCEANRPTVLSHQRDIQVKLVFCLIKIFTDFQVAEIESLIFGELPLVWKRKLWRLQRELVAKNAQGLKTLYCLFDTWWRHKFCWKMWVMLCFFLHLFEKSCGLFVILSVFRTRNWSRHRRPIMLEFWFLSKVAKFCFLSAHAPPPQSEIKIHWNHLRSGRVLACVCSMCVQRVWNVHM